MADGKPSGCETMTKRLATAWLAYFKACERRADAKRAASQEDWELHRVEIAAQKEIEVAQAEMLAPQKVDYQDEFDGIE